MDPIIAEMTTALENLVREYFRRAPQLANQIMRAPVALGIALYSIAPGAKKELCKQWLDGIFADFCKTHQPWQDPSAGMIWTPPSDDKR